MGELLYKLRVRIGHELRNLPGLIQLRFCLELIQKASNEGRFKSIRQGPVDGKGVPLPWLTPSSIYYLNNLDISEKRMLEFGAGHSTVWFSHKVRDILSFECSEIWISVLRQRFQYNGKIQLVDEDFDGSDIDFSTADLVLVDGLDRTGILNNIIFSLDTGTRIELLIIDNPEFINDLTLTRLDSYFHRIDFVGVANGSWQSTTTTIMIPK